MEHQEETFSECLRRLMQRHALNQTQLSQRAWLDFGYVSRLVHSTYDPLNPRLTDSAKPVDSRRHPGRDVVIRLGIAMQLPIEEMDELLMRAGYAPLTR